MVEEEIKNKIEHKHYHGNGSNLCYHLNKPDNAHAIIYINLELASGATPYMVGKTSEGWKPWVSGTTYIEEVSISKYAIYADGDLISISDAEAMEKIEILTDMVEELGEEIDTIDEWRVGLNANVDSGEDNLVKVSAEQVNGKLNNVSVDDSKLDAELAKKVEKEIVGDAGKAMIFNEADGGGAKFEYNDGTASYVGVHDKSNGVGAQIYVDKSETSGSEGTIIDVTESGAYYHKGAYKNATARDIAENEIATIGDIEGQKLASRELVEVRKADGTPIYDADIAAMVGTDYQITLRKEDGSNYDNLRDLIQASKEHDAALVLKKREYVITDVYASDSEDGFCAVTLVSVDGKTESGHTTQPDILYGVIYASKVAGEAPDTEHIFIRVDSLMADIQAFLAPFLAQINAAISALTTNLGNEIARATSAETAINSKIDSAVAAVETALDGKVNIHKHGSNGEAYIFNESDGGGARFVHNDGSEAFVGVNDGGKDGMMAQIYADVEKDGKWSGSRINVYNDKIYYQSKAKTDDGVAKNDPSLEIATIGDITGTVGGFSIVKNETAETGYFASYHLEDNNHTKKGATINIPKDYLVKSGEVKTVTEKDVPYSGAEVGDKYIDFVVNVKEGTATDEHIYLPVKDLVDVYTADETTLHLDENNKFSANTDVEGGVASYAAMEGEIARAKAEEAKKVEKEIVGDAGKAMIFNEADGGGAKFEYNDGTASYVGVHDKSNGVGAQIYVDKDATTGVIIDVTGEKAYYHKGEFGTAETRDVDKNEIATIGDIEKTTLTAGNGIVITSDNEITFDPDVLSTVDYVDGSISDTLLYIDQQDTSEHAGRVAGDNLLQAAITAEETRAKEEEAKKVDKEIIGTNGTATIFNEADGGGAKFVNNDGTESFIGVNDGGEEGLAAQIYADKLNGEGKWEGAKIDVTNGGMYYTVGDKSFAERAVEDNEIATKGDIKAHVEYWEELTDNMPSSDENK